MRLPSYPAHLSLRPSPLPPVYWQQESLTRGECTILEMVHLYYPEIGHM